MMANLVGLHRPGRTRAARVASPNGLLYPLDAAYERAGVVPPKATPLAPADLPSPYRSLLDHERDMTLTLEAHVGGRVALRVLSTFTKGRSYFRRVLLVEESTGRPVEMGAIRITPAAFPARIRAAIQQNERPLGRLLRDGGIDFVSRPKTFLAVTPNSEMMGVFWMREPRTLYGRQTAVFVAGKQVGDIVEILPLM